MAHTAAAALLLQCGPPLVLFIGVIAPRSLLVLLTLFSAFLWSATLLVLSTLLAGVVTADAGPWRFAIIVSLAVALEEGVRWWLYSLHSRGTRVLGDLASKNPRWRFTPADECLLAFAVGYGQAAAHALAFSVSWLPLAAGKGVLYASACHGMSYAPAAAFTMLGIFFLHAGSTVVAFAGADAGSMLQAAAPGLAHLAAALMTVLNLRHNVCATVAGGELVLGCVMLAAAAAVYLQDVQAHARSYMCMLSSEDHGDSAGPGVTS